MEKKSARTQSLESKKQNCCSFFPPKVVVMPLRPPTPFFYVAHKASYDAINM